MELFVLAIIDNPNMLERAQAEWEKYQLGIYGVKDVRKPSEI